jgi:hypothetical protein
MFAHVSQTCDTSNKHVVHGTLVKHANTTRSVTDFRQNNAPVGL